MDNIEYEEKGICWCAILKDVRAKMKRWAVVNENLPACIEINDTRL